MRPINSCVFNLPLCDDCRGGLLSELIEIAAMTQMTGKFTPGSQTSSQMARRRHRIQQTLQHASAYGKKVQCQRVGETALLSLTQIKTLDEQTIPKTAVASGRRLRVYEGA